jgi:hypothetical protein
MYTTYSDNPDFAVLMIAGVIVIFLLLFWIVEILLPKIKWLQKFFERFS